MHRPYPSLAAILRHCKVTGTGEDATASIKVSELHLLLRAFASAMPFSEQQYFRQYPQFEEFKAAGIIGSGRQHWVANGYLEGRQLVGWETIPFDINLELIHAPQDYFDTLAHGLSLELEERYLEAEEAYRSAIAGYHFHYGALYALAQLYITVRRPLDALPLLLDFISKSADTRAAQNAVIEIYLELGLTRLLISQTAEAVNCDISFEMVVSVLADRDIKRASTWFKTAIGDAILAQSTQATIRGTIRDARQIIQLTRNAIREGQKIERSAAVRVARVLAQLGFVRMAQKMSGLQTDKISYSDFKSGPLETKIDLLETARLADSDAVAAEIANEIDSDGDLDIYRIRTAYLAGRFAEVVHLTSGKQDTEMGMEICQYLTWSLVLLGRPHEALAIAGIRWQFASSWRWLPSVVFAAARGLKLYDCLSNDEAQPLSNVNDIPKCIIQFWDSEEPPPDVRAAMESVRAMNPDYEYKQFTDESARIFMQEIYGDYFVELYDACYHPAMKSDFFRVAFLAINGGIYIDADESAYRPLSELIGIHPDKDFFVRLSVRHFFVTNGFIACPPSHKIMFRVLLNIKDAMVEYLESGLRPNIWDATGPTQFTRALAESMIDAAMDRDRETIRKVGFILHHTLNGFVATTPMEYKSSRANWRVAALSEPIAKP
jgi:hypothetical protein